MGRLYHIATELRGCHCGKVWRACVVFTATNDCYTTQLTWEPPLAHAPSLEPCRLPLWKLSSIGGIILYTLLMISFLEADAIVKTVFHANSY